MNQPPWDWSGFSGVAFDVCNPTPQSVTFGFNMTDNTPENGSQTMDNSDSLGGEKIALYPQFCGSVPYAFQSPFSALLMGMQNPPSVPGYMLARGLARALIFPIFTPLNFS